MGAPTRDPLAIFRAGPLTLSSIEIAERTKKRHDNVMRDIRAMLAEMHGEEGLLRFEDTHRNEQNGQDYPIFRLPKHECLTLITGYSVPLRAAILARWIELEAGQPVAPALPDFANPAAAARAWAEQYEARVTAERTKAEIGSRREATAMNTASQAVKQVGRLEIELGKSKQYASVKRMQMLYHGQEFSWRLLKSTSARIGIPPEDVFDQNYGKVNAYHADVWREAYALEIPAMDRD